MPDHEEASGEEAIGRPGRQYGGYGPSHPDNPNTASRHGLAIGAAVVVGAVVLGLALGSSSNLPLPVASSGQLSGPILTSFSAAGVQTVSIDAIAGKVAVIASGSAVVTDAGSTAPLFYQFDSATHTLQLFCPGPRNCAAEDYTVTIPEHVGLVLHQVSGQTTLTGLSGPVDITASSVSVNAIGLDTSSFTASITSGQLSAAFTEAPRRTVLDVVSASVSLSLPGSASYTVVRHVTSGDINVSVPQNPNATDVVDATIVSGEISLADG